MKISKLLITGLMALGSAGAAMAAGPSDGTISATHIYIVGSTAYRAAVAAAIEDMLGGKANCSLVAVGGSHGEYNGNAVTYSGTIQSTSAFQGGPSLNGGTGSAVPVTLSGSNTAVVIETYWTGSLAGCTDVSATNSVTGFIPDGYLTTAAAGFSNTALTGTAQTVSHVANVAFSDSFPGSVETSISTASGGNAYAKKIAGANLTQAGSLGEAAVGIVPFVWVAGAVQSGTTPFTNMTQQAASALCSNGFVPAMTLLSSTAVGTTDTNDWVFLIGRNEDSGTRIAAQSESQLGISQSSGAAPTQSFGNSMVQFYCEFLPTYGTISTDGSFVQVSGAYPTNNEGGSLGPQASGAIYQSGTGTGQAIQTGGTGCVVYDAGEWPAGQPLNTEASVAWASSGHSGQIGGGDVASVLQSLNPLYLNMTDVDGGLITFDITWDPLGNGNSTDKSNKAYLVGYLGTADAYGITSISTYGGPGANAYGITGATTAEFLTYNGVPYSPTNVYNGSYTFWTFEHMFYRTDGAANKVSGITKTIADNLADVVYKQDCQTDSHGKTDTTTPAVGAVADVAGLYLNSNAKFTKALEGQPLSPTTW